MQITKMTLAAVRKRERETEEGGEREGQRGGGSDM